MLSFANKVVKVQLRKFVCSLYRVPRTLHYLYINRLSVCQCLSHCLYRGNLCAGRYTLIEIVVEERKRVNSSKSAKVLWVRREERRVTLRKWKECLTQSSKEEWARLLIRNFDVWLERGHGQLNFYLTPVTYSHGAFNVYLFRMKPTESPIALTAIEEGEVMMPGTPCLNIWNFDCTGKTQWPPYKRWANSLLRYVHTMPHGTQWHSMTRSHSKSRAMPQVYVDIESVRLRHAIRCCAV